MNNDVSGIYYILNTLNNKVYIGSSCHINRRFYEHRYFLNKNIHSNKHLQSAWNKYGEDSFEFGVIELVDSEKEDLLEVEQIWLDYFKSYDDKNGYNISIYAEGAGGYEVSEETREKIRKWHTGQKASEETRKKLSLQRIGMFNNFYGKHHSEETKKKLHYMKIGNKPTEKQLRNLEKGRMIANGVHSKEIHQKSAFKRRGERSRTVKLKEEKVVEILIKLKQGELEKDIAECYGISIQTVSRIKNRKRWGYLYEQMPELYT